MMDSEIMDSEMSETSRRRFLSHAAWLPALVAARGRAADPPRILLMSSWQSVNIGDNGHTPGALGLLE